MTIISLPHKVLDYACPINGLEDQYEWKTGTRLPGFFLMDLSNIGFTYIRHKLAPAPRMITWGNGVGKAQYQFLADIIGYHWECHEGGGFNSAWQGVLTLIQKGTPVIIGVLDMFHLPYFEKFYHRFHIPYHFVQVIGFDEVSNVVLVQDNSLAKIQSIPISDLRAAWNVSVPGQSKPFTYYVFNFSDQITPLQEIAMKGLPKSAEIYLHGENSRQGSLGILKAGQDIINWREELSPQQFKASLEFLATFTCSVVPNPPQALLTYPLGYKDSHQAIRDRFAGELEQMAQEYDQPHWQKAAKFFLSSGEKIGILTDIAVQTLQGDEQAFSQADPLLKEIHQLEVQAFQCLLTD
ncbi:MAG: hypothetical protein C0410_10125 [Anaerolinea sp.]|nr:hypothetical protein [Anaerolinea sp.]